MGRGAPGGGPSEALTGALFVLLSGCGYGAVTVLAKVAFEAGSNAPTSLALRFGLAGVILWLLLAGRRQVRRLPARKAGQLALMGVLFASGSVASFMSVERIPAGLSSLLLYVYPAIVTAGSALLFGTRFTATQLAILVAAISGCALTVDLRSGAIDGVGVALALVTPLFYATYVLLGSRATLGVPPLMATVWIMSCAAPLMIALGLSGATGDRLTFAIERSGWLAILGLAVFSTVISTSAFLAGLARLDPFRASILSTVEPVVSVALAAALLSERLTPQQAAGGAMIVGSAIALQMTRRGMRDEG